MSKYILTKYVLQGKLNKEYHLPNPDNIYWDGDDWKWIDLEHSYLYDFLEDIKDQKEKDFKHCLYRIEETEE